MPLDIQRQHPSFFARVTGADLSAPLDDDTFAAIETAFAEHAILHFPGQVLTQEQQIAFSRRFGSLEIVTIGATVDGNKRLPFHEIVQITNLGLDNRIREADNARLKFAMANRLWHSDSTFKHVPALASILYALIVPSRGGDTEFADLKAAYDDLPDAMKARIDDLVVEHSIYHSRAKVGFTDFTPEARASHPPVRQVLVRVHPRTGRKSLYLASHASHIVGWPVDEGRALVDELIAHATQPKYVHAHRWKSGDVVMWDNRFTMHRATGFDDRNEPRELHRTTVQDVGNSVELRDAAARAGA